MRKWIVLIALACGTLLALSDSGEAGLLGRRRCPPPCCPCPCVCPTAPAAVAEVPWSQTIVTAKGRVYRVAESAIEDEQETDVADAAVGAATNPDDFNGTSRKKAKTSFVEGMATEYSSVWKLRESLPSEAEMEALDIPFGRGSQNSDRVEQEKRVVTVTAYLYAFNKQNDHDYHLIVGDALDDPQGKFMNMEVSGLPVSGQFRDKLQTVRNAFKTRFQLGEKGPKKYAPVNPPMKVRISGSIFYDKDHSPPKPYVKHNGFEPKTAWEIHPITGIEFDLDP